MKRRPLIQRPPLASRGPTVCVRAVEPLAAPLTQSMRSVRTAAVRCSRSPLPRSTTSSIRACASRVRRTPKTRRRRRSARVSVNRSAERIAAANSPRRSSSRANSMPASRRTSSRRDGTAANHGQCTPARAPQRRAIGLRARAGGARSLCAACAAGEASGATVWAARRSPNVCSVLSWHCVPHRSFPAWIWVP